MSQHQYIQLPPDSTGKKILHRAEVVLSYKNGVSAFLIGNRVTGSISGSVGDVTFLSGTVNSGEIHLQMTSQSSVSFIDGEDLEVESIKYAESDGVGSPIYISGAMLISGKSTENSATIDNDGSLYVRFDSGDPALDLTNRQEVVNPITISDHNFKYNKTADNRFSIVTDGTASTTYLTDMNSVRMQVGMTTGDKVTMQSNEYHIVPAGVAYGSIFTLWVGDTGKENCRRRWGYFDEEDGYFFELNGTTLNVVWRTSASGSLVEYRIPQNEWNQDKVNGQNGVENKSGINIDVSKTQIFYIESAGSGGTTMGLFINGTRVRLHSFVFSGYFSGVATRKSGQLPIRFELENTGETSSTSEIYPISISVLANTTGDSLYNVRKGLGSLSNISVPVGSDWTHMFSIRPAKTYNGKDNRAWIYPYLTTLLSDTAPIIYTVAIAPSTSLAGVDDGNWTQQGLAEYSLDSTSSTPFNQAVFDMAGSNEVIKCNHLSQGINPSEAKLIRYADIDADPMTVSVFCKSLGAATNVTISFTWMELY